MADERRHIQHQPITYRNRISGHGGGYGQTGPGLNYGGDEPDIGSPYRTAPSPEFAGYHFGSYQARHYGGPNERERRLAGMPPARNYRGLGPRGPARRDSRIAEDVNDRLTEDDWLDATDVEATVVAGEVTLSGTVDSRQAKRRAEDIAESVSGVRDVFNQLRIQSDRLGTIPGPSGQPTRRTRWETVKRRTG
jgi:hypothetical protein